MCAIGVPDSHAKDKFMRQFNFNTLLAFIKACGDGDLAAVMDFIPWISDINQILPDGSNNVCVYASLCTIF